MKGKLYCKKRKFCQKDELSVDIEIVRIGNQKAVFIRFIGQYKMGTIGVDEGNVIVKAFEYATRKKMPVITETVSGGIRINEGTPALMQMVTIASAVKKHSDKGLLYIAIVFSPTLGGTSASLVALADIIVAENKAIYGFAGKRIVENTTNEKLPDDFQTVEYAQRHGMVDIVADKDELHAIIHVLLMVIRF